MQTSYDKAETIIMGFPPTPFLLIEEFKEKGNIYHVVEEWEGCTIDIDENNQFTQTFTWIGHEASDEEIETFLSEET